MNQQNETETDPLKQNKPMVTKSREWWWVKINKQTNK